MTEREQPPTVPGHILDRIVGRGASAVVWSGTDPTGRPVAVKVRERPSDAADLAQARAEQHVLRAVRHEHLVPLRDAVALEDGRTALVFDLVPGQLLGGMVRSRGQLRAGEAVTILTPISEAVAALHSAGGLHGDISPGNVMVTPSGRPVLLDLGSARVAGAEPGAVHGTPGFLAPEVRAGDEPSEASDVYSLGALAWFCVTGNGAPDTALRLDPEVVQSHVGSALAAVIGACIDPDPARRPTSAELPRSWYDAAAPEPVEVVVGLDPAEALTHRLREAAVRSGRCIPRSDVTGEYIDPTGPRGPRLWPRRAGVAAAVAVPLLAAAGWALAARAPVGPMPPAPLSPGRSAPDVPAGVAAASVGPAGVRPAGIGPAGSAAGQVASLLSATDSPSVRPLDVLQVLSDRRGEALVQRDASALGAVHVDGSPSAHADQLLVASLRASGTRWVGLRAEVSEARFVSGDRGTVVIRARVDWTAYAVVDVHGVRGARAAERGALLDFHLEWAPAGWRIASISAAPAT